MKFIDTIYEISQENINYNGYEAWKEIIYSTGPYAYARAFTEFFGYKYSNKYFPLFQ